MNAALARHLPLLDQLKDYDATTARSDAAAGLTTAIMLVPQAMAYAMLAGLEPIVGLYASTVPLVVYGLMGTSRQLAVGPAAMVSLLVASGLSAVAGASVTEMLGLAALLAVMVGVMQWGMGIARLGFLAKFLSQPVIAGFASAAAIIIGTSQLTHVLGLQLPRGTHFLHTLVLAAKGLPDVNLATLGVAVVTMGLLVGLKRWAPKVPRFMLVVAGGAIAAKVLGLQALGVAIIGDVPGQLPALAVPPLDWSKLQALFPAAITIALVSFVESISVARSFARKNRYEIDPNQELKALGLANIAAGLVQAYPITGGLSRTAVNAQAGAKTGVAGLVTAAAIVITLLFLTPLFYYLPKAVLASIILTAVVGLFAVDEAKYLWKVSRPDLAAMAITFVATLVLGIQLGIVAGVGASLMWFIYKTSQPHVAVLGELPDSRVYRNVERYPEAQTRSGVVALRIDAPLYFANTGFLKDTLTDALSEDTRHLVIDFKGIGSVDAQALSTFEEIIEELERRNTVLWLAGVRGPVRDALTAAHLTERIGVGHMVERVFEAVDQTGQDLKAAS